MIGISYNKKLMCHFYGWRVITDGQLALDLENGECCHMKGALDIARNIMPDVWRIATFSGGKPDTEYRIVDGKWVAYDPPRIVPARKNRRGEIYFWHTANCAFSEAERNAFNKWKHDLWVASEDAVIHANALPENTVSQNAKTKARALFQMIREIPIFQKK